MSNIFRCKRCNDTFISEEFDNHTCTPRLNDFRNCEFDYYCITKDSTGKETIMIKGMDGILYQFNKRECLETDKVPISDETLQGDNSDNIRRRFDGAKHRKIY